MSACEWDPVRNVASDGDEYHAEATVSVGANGQWHLCAECAALPWFKRFRSRRALKPASPDPGVKGWDY